MRNQIGNEKSIAWNRGNKKIKAITAQEGISLLSRINSYKH